MWELLNEFSSRFKWQFARGRVKTKETDFISSYGIDRMMPAVR